jgi:hypothetical protein
VTLRVACCAWLAASMEARTSPHATSLACGSLRAPLARRVRPEPAC